MLPFIVAAIILLLGVALGALALISYTAKLEFASMAEDLKTQLVNIRALAMDQTGNMTLLETAVTAFTTYEQNELGAVKKSAERLTRAQTPGQLQDATRGANKALDNLNAVCAYYPPLLIDQAYLSANERVTETRDALQRAIVHYNTEVKRYNQKLNQFSNKLLAKRFKFENFNPITLRTQ